MPTTYSDKSDRPLQVSALIASRQNPHGETEFLNVRARDKTKYGFPGGKIETCETPEQAVVRETIEELGAEPTDLDLVGKYSSFTPEGRKIDMYVFTGSIPDDISPQAEIAELHWLTYEQMTERSDLLTPMTIEHVLSLLKDI